MAFDRAGLKTLIRAAGFGSDAQSAAAQDSALDAVFLELAGEREWSWLLARNNATSLTVGSEFVTSPADLVAPRSLRLSRGAANTNPHYMPLSRVDGEVARDWNWVDQGTDLPDTWAWVDRRIVVYPKPDFAYNVDLSYVKYPDVTTFDADVEAAQFDIRFHPVIAWGAIRWLAIRQRNTELYAQATAEYERGKRNFIRADEGNTEQTHVETWPGWSVLDADFRV